MKAVVAAILGSLALSAQQASIEGVTVNVQTSQPIPGVHVRLLAATFRGINAAYGAISDREGHFSIATVRPGTYVLAPERSGYLYYTTKGSPAIPNITLRPGQQLTGMRVELAPRAILSGRVVDERGDPVQGVTMQVAALNEKDQPTYLLGNPEATTDDRGEFRIATVSGRFYVQARPIAASPNEKPEVRDGTELTPYRSTFYPSTAIKARAVAVEAVGGKETEGLEIRLTRQQGTSITGTVRGIPDPAIRAYVIAQWGDSPNSTSGGTSVATDAEGRFTIADVQAAYYRLSAGWSGRPQMASPLVQVKVDQADVTNIELTLMPGGELSGNVEIAGQDTPPADKFTVRLESTTNSSGPMGPTKGTADEKGAFSLTNVGPGRYRVRVSPLPPNGYVKRLVLDGAEIPGAALDLSKGVRASTLKATLGLDAAQISGHVLDENGERMLTAVAAVVLARVPLPDAPNADMVARSSPDGSYSYRQLAPGKYRILSVDAFSNAYTSESELFQLLDQAEEIELKPGMQLQKDVRVLPKKGGAGAKAKQ